MSDLRCCRPPEVVELPTILELGAHTHHSDAGAAKTREAHEKTTNKTRTQWAHKYSPTPVRCNLACWPVFWVVTVRAPCNALRVFLFWLMGSPSAGTSWSAGASSGRVHRSVLSWLQQVVALRVEGGVMRTSATHPRARYEPWRSSAGSRFRWWTCAAGRPQTHRSCRAARQDTWRFFSRVSSDGRALRRLIASDIGGARDGRPLCAMGLALRA